MVNPLDILWTDRCTVCCREKVRDPDTGLTDFVETTVAEDLPCRLSFSALAVTGADHTATLAQTVKLILSPEVSIPAGSKLLVTRGKDTLTYARSGQPAVYSLHQEVLLVPFTRYA